MHDDWDVIRDALRPALDCRSADPTVVGWTVGPPRDAVAFAFACDDAVCPSPKQLMVFLTNSEQCTDLPVFTDREAADLPDVVRRRHLRAAGRGRWVPSAEVLSRIRPTEPTCPVDVVTLRTDGPNGVEFAVGQLGMSALRQGGTLLLLGDTAPDVLGPDFEPIGRTGRLFAKVSPGPTHASTTTDLPDPSTVTLADPQRRAELVSSHLGLARSLARRFAYRGERLEDLEGVALLALVRASRRYELDHVAGFSSFATVSILGELKRHFRDRAWMVRVPRSTQERYLAVKDAREYLEQHLGGTPTIADIARHLRVGDEDVLSAMEAGENYSALSLDRPAAFDGDSGTDVPVVDHRFDLALDLHQLRDALRALEPEQQLLIRRLYFEGRSQRDVAAELGVSQMQVSRLSRRVITTLRKAFAVQI